MKLCTLNTARLSDLPWFLGSLSAPCDIFGYLMENAAYANTFRSGLFSDTKIDTYILSTSSRIHIRSITLSYGVRVTLRNAIFHIISILMLLKFRGLCKLSKWHFVSNFDYTSKILHWTWSRWMKLCRNSALSSPANCYFWHQIRLVAWNIFSYLFFPQTQGPLFSLFYSISCISIDIVANRYSSVV